ncbi:MAG: alpha/beta hydrolase [Desulfotignum sp.]|nr:alpha/beta hydrolase [Desulfobacteraceae bacterium]
MRILFILVIAVLVFLVGLYFFSRKLLYFPVSITPERLAYITARIPGVEEIQIPVEKKVVLHGWFLQKDLAGLPTIFYFGGNAEEVSLNLEDYAAKISANVVLVNYRGYGLSTGSPAEDLLKSDALAIYDHMAERFGLDPARCAAWGRSLGSSIAAHLVLERDLGRQILTCPFDSIQNVAAGYYPSWLVNLVLQDRHRTIDFSPRITSPTLVLAAADDEVIAFSHTQKLYDSLTCPKQLVPIPGAGHNTISAFPAYFEAVNTFLQKDPSHMPLGLPE